MRNTEILKLKQHELIRMMQTTHSYGAFKHAIRRLIDIASPGPNPLILSQKQTDPVAERVFFIALLFNLLLVCVNKFIQDEKKPGKNKNPIRKALVSLERGSGNPALFKDILKHIEFDHLNPDDKKKVVPY